MASSSYSRIGTIAIKPDGDTLWLRFYDPCPGFNQQGRDLSAARPDGPAIAGASRDSTNVWCIATVKYSAQGSQQWVQRYSDAAHYLDFPSAIDEAKSGRYLVTGQSGLNSANTDIVTLSYDSSGALEWAQCYAGSAGSHDIPYTVTTDRHGAALVTGSARTQNAYDDALITIKYDSTGQCQWVRPLELPDVNACGYALVVDSMGSAYVAGAAGPYLTNFLTVRLSAGGDTMWTRQRYMGTAAAIALSPDGTVVVTGTDSRPGGIANIVTLKYSAAGVLLWEAVYDGPNHIQDWGYDVAVSRDGSIYVCGRSQCTAPDYDCILIKYDALGDTAWTARISDAIGKSVMVDTAGDVIVAGNVSREPTREDYLIAKYPPSGPGVADKRTAPAWAETSPEAIPSVVSRRCRLMVRAGEHQVNLIIADITGRTVRGILVPSARAGDRVSVAWDTRDEHGRLVPNGVYFVRVAQAQAQAVCKVIVQRK
jgi:hypothetical protein